MPQLLVTNSASSSADAVPLLLDFRREAEQFLEKFQRIEDLIKQDRSIQHSSWQTNPVDQGSAIGLPLINWPDRPPLRLNQLYWPTGASRFAYGLFLCNGEQKRQIEAMACQGGTEQPLTIKAATDSAAKMDQLLGEGPREVEFALYLLTPQRVTGCQEPGNLDPDGILPTQQAGDYDLYILPFVDARYWWQFARVPTPCGNDTWTTLVGEIETGLGISLQSFTPGSGNPHRSAWARSYHNAAQLLDAALESTGQRLVARYDGTFWAETYLAAQATWLANYRLMQLGGDQLAGSLCSQPLIRAVPEYVEVLFPKASCGLPCGHCTDVGCVEDYYRIQVAAADALDRQDLCVRAGAYKTIHVRGYADMNCSCASGEPANLGILNTIADELARAWYGLNSMEYGYTFTGPWGWTLCGFDDHALFKFGIEYDDCLRAEGVARTDDPRAREAPLDIVLHQEHRRDYATRVQSWPPNVGSDCALLDTGVGERTSTHAIATATTCITPEMGTGSATLSPSGSAGPCAVTIDNSDCLILALPGDAFPVMYDDDCEGDCVWRPAGQFGTTRWVRIKAELNCCETAKVRVLMDASDSSAGGGDPGSCPPLCAMVESECEITVLNTTGRKIACDTDCEDVLATLIPGKTCIWYLHDKRRPLRARATLTDELCGGGSGSIVDIEYLDVCEWTPSEEPTTAQNPYSLYACAYDKVELAWNDLTCLWEIVQVPDHQLPGPVLDIRCKDSDSTCVVERERPKYASYGHSCKCDSETVWTDSGFTGTIEELPTGITAGWTNGGSSGDNCPTGGGTLSLRLTTTRFCVWCGPASGTAGTPISFPLTLSLIEPITQVLLTCNPCPVITPSTTPMYAFCVGTETQSDPQDDCECNTCESSS